MIKANSIIQDANKEYDKKEINVSATNGKDYKVVLDKKFKKTKMVKLITDMGVRANHCVANEIVFDYTLTTWALILKYFTDIQFNEYKDLTKTYMKECETVGALVDLGLLDQIINKFDNKEVEKLNTLFTEFKDYTSKLTEVEIGQFVNGIVGEE